MVSEYKISEIPNNSLGLFCFWQFFAQGYVPPLSHHKPYVTFHPYHNPPTFLNLLPAGGTGCSPLMENGPESAKNEEKMQQLPTTFPITNLRLALVLFSKIYFRSE